MKKINELIKNLLNIIIKNKEIKIFYNSKKFYNLFHLIKKLSLILLLFLILMRNIINNFKRYKKFFDYKIKKYQRKYLNLNHNPIKKLDINISYGINVLICAIIKQESLYLEEFIEYYIKLGIKKMILYDNNDLDDENLNYLLNKTIFQDFIEIIDYRGISHAQKKAYNDCYNNNKYIYDWIAFFDIDEFLYLNGFQNINEFLSL